MYNARATLLRNAHCPEVSMSITIVSHLNQSYFMYAGNKDRSVESTEGIAILAPSSNTCPS
jgi:hypothetical protein